MAANRGAGSLTDPRTAATFRSTLPGGSSGVAQLAERSAVNRLVVGSSPTAGAISERAQLLELEGVALFRSAPTASRCTNVAHSRPSGRWSFLTDPCSAGHGGTPPRSERVGCRGPRGGSNPHHSPQPGAPGRLRRPRTWRIFSPSVEPPRPARGRCSWIRQPRRSRASPGQDRAPDGQMPGHLSGGPRRCPVEQAADTDAFAHTGGHRSSMPS